MVGPVGRSESIRDQENVPIRRSSNENDVNVVDMTRNKKIERKRNARLEKTTFPLHNSPTEKEVPVFFLLRSAPPLGYSGLVCPFSFFFFHLIYNLEKKKAPLLDPVPAPSFSLFPPLFF